MRERLLSTFLMLAVLLTGFATEVGAQQKQKEIRIEFKKAPMSDVLKKLQKTSGYQILFTYDDVKRITVEGPLVAKDINDALRQLFEGRPFAYTVDGKYVSVLLKENVERKQPLQRQKTYKVSGFVMDTQQGTLPGASVAVEGTSIMVVADESGHFSLNLPLGVKSTIVVSYVGMKTARRTFYLLEQMPIDTVSIKQRWEAMLNVSGGKAIELHNSLKKKYQPSDDGEIGMFRMPAPEYVTMMKALADVVYASDTNDPDILKMGREAASVAANFGGQHGTFRSQELSLRYANAVFRRTAKSLVGTLGYARQDNDTRKAAAIEALMQKYGINEADYTDSNPDHQRMSQDEKEQEEHMANKK